MINTLKIMALASFMIIPQTHIRAQNVDPAECSLQKEGIHGVLDRKSPLLKNYQAVDHIASKREFSESAQIKDDVSVEFKTGGCHSIYYQLVYRSLKEQKVSDIIYATNLLQQTPTINDTITKTWLPSLKKQVETFPQRSQSIQQLSCGEATCTLDLTQKGIFRFYYEFAL